MNSDRTNGDRVREELRILRAAADGRLLLNEHGRYIIVGDQRPWRKERERLIRYLWLYRPRGSDCIIEITAEGRSALANLEATVGV